jgi:PAS domain S-box-containing protein
MSIRVKSKTAYVEMVLEGLVMPEWRTMLEDLGVLLRAREQELTAIYENVPGIVFYIAVEPVREFRFLSVSREFLAVTGLSREQVVGSLVREVIPPPSCDMVLEHYRAAIRSRQTVRWKEKSVYPAGQRYGEVAVTPLYDASGRATHLIGIVHDITEREQQLSKVNERLRLALEAGSTGGWDFDVKTGETLLFGMAHAQLGMSPDDASGARKDFWDRVHEDDVEHYRAAIAAAREKKEPFNVEFRIVRRDGAIRWLRTQGRYYYTGSGAPERLLGISLDITERKEAEQILRENEQRLRLATQAGRIYAYEWDAIKDVVTRSSEDLERLGLAESLRGHQQQFVDTIHPGDRAQYLAAVAGLNPENPIAEVTYRARTSKGTLLWLKSSGRGFFDENGKLLRVIGMTADITDVKRAEELLADMTRKLIDSQERERKRIGRELHDDINQRLALLSVELETLQQSPSELQSRVPKLRKELRQISDDVQGISHDLHSSKMEILGVVAAMKSWCKEVSARRKVEVAFNNDFSGSLPLDLGIPLFRVLQQAVDNAIRHSGEKRIEVRLREDRNEIHLIVRDTGKGFDVEAATRGKGLGLTSMRERVRLVNGTICIDSKPRGGTKIDVHIPLSQQSNAEQLSA